MLDTRQYRSDQAYGDGWRTPGPESTDPRRTLTGAKQERWLIDGWRSSSALWNVLSQQVTFSERRNATGPGYKLSMDSWDGYPASRERVLKGAEAAGVDNLVVLTGDVHVHYAFDVKRDFKNEKSRTVGVEFVTTSIASGAGRRGQARQLGHLYGRQPAHEVLQRPPRLCDRHAGPGEGAGRLPDGVGGDEAGGAGGHGGVVRVRGRRPGAEAGLIPVRQGARVRS
ncbi:hypothetical protein SRIMM317S_03426 [Streptomyces rimosus subsp. rimosus]